MTDTFEYWGIELKYCRDSYNHSGENERAVEIPIAQWWLEHQIGIGLEIGNVMAHYGRVHWPVVDRYEPGATLNLDVFDYNGPADWILAISTLEHVRWDEPGMGRHPDGSSLALEHLYSLLRPGGVMLVTVPMGWQPFFDTAILDEKLPVYPDRQCTLVRSEGRWWWQTPEVEHRRYAASSIWAESVWVAEFSR